MSQGHRLYDQAALRKNKIEKLRLDGMRASSPRLSGTGSARDLSRSEVSNDWLVGGKSGGSLGGRSFTPRAMPWEKQPAVEDSTSIRQYGEERESQEAFEQSGGTGKYEDMLSSARTQVRSSRSRSATGVASPAACSNRDRKDHRQAGGGSMGPGFRSSKNMSPRFKDPKHNGMFPKDLPGPAGSYTDNGQAAEENDKRVNKQNWQGHTTVSKRDETRSSPWAASKSPKLAALSHAAGYADNCTTLMVSNYYDGVTEGTRIREMLRESFEPFGRVRSVRLTKAYNSALVEFDTHEDALTALRFLQDPNDVSMRPKWAADITADFHKDLGKDVDQKLSFQQHQRDQ